MKTCECGCGAEVRRRFLPGHQWRVLWQDEERRKRQGEKSKARGAKPPNALGKKFPERGKGRKVSDETRQKISQAHKASPKVAAWAEKMRTVRTGELNPNWQGGKAKQPYAYEWTEDLKQIIRDRDYGICQSCGIPSRTKKLDVHHLDGNKKNCEPTNLITLCHTCHQRWHGGTDIPIEHRQLEILVIKPPPPQPRRAKYASLREQAGELYAQGNTMSAVAEHLGYKVATINYWLRTAGYTRDLSQSQQLRRERESAADPASGAKATSKAVEASRQKQLALSELIRQEALRRYQAGQSGNQIEAELGVQKQTVVYWAKKAGIIRTKSEAQLMRHRQRERLAS